MDKFKTNEQTSQKIPKEVLDQIRRDGMPDFSSLGLYGNSAVFAKRLKEGYTEFAMGRGPWINDFRIVGIAVFYGKGDRIATFETIKSCPLGDITRGSREMEYSSAEFDKFTKEYKLEIGPKTAMKELVEAWIK
ncbi:MAG: hypothetical protein KGH54_00690 [Candidatus Micrarchaeota archaeon]|nr:hypothetical protein [Candidatus Micrarchaeota archaeon]